jgi:hypothetical protein
LYWSYNCDSSWLTFSNNEQQKILFSLGEGLVHLTGRLGFSFAFEYKNSFLIQNNVISGCCSPPEYFIFDKNTGELRRSLGRIIYYSNSKEKPFIIRISNSNYDPAIKADYQSLSIVNLEQDKEFHIALPKGQLDKALRETEQNYPEYLFDEPTVEDNRVTLTYHIKKPKSKTDKKVKKIFIELKKYSS